MQIVDAPGPWGEEYANTPYPARYVACKTWR
jgi:hypothetical protein